MWDFQKNVVCIQTLQGLLKKNGQIKEKIINSYRSLEDSVKIYSMGAPN